MFFCSRAAAFGFPCASWRGSWSVFRGILLEFGIAAAIEEMSKIDFLKPMLQLLLQGESMTNQELHEALIEGANLFEKQSSFKLRESLKLNSGDFISIMVMRRFSSIAGES
jgi:hypothetical protein